MLSYSYPLKFTIAPICGCYLSVFAAASVAAVATNGFSGDDYRLFAFQFTCTIPFA